MSRDVPHRPVLLEEALAALAVKPHGSYLDCTFGRGGHSTAILARLGADGRLTALDRDLEAIEAAQRIDDRRFCVLHASFGALRQALASRGVGHVDGVLFDLGVSSPQLDNDERGFSFRREAPLDMRMDQSRGLTAAQWLNEVNEQQLAEVIKQYGEERFAKQIARAIVAARKNVPLATTGQLAALVAGAVKTRERGQDPATRTFQAIRIFINRELEELALGLAQAVELLTPLGRLVVISFHSLEDRIVKRFLGERARPPQPPARLPLRAAQLPKPTLRLVGKPTRPSAAEVAANPRARSALMRVAEKLEAA